LNKAASNFLAIQEIAHQGSDFPGVRFQLETPRIEQVDCCIGQIRLPVEISGWPPLSTILVHAVRVNRSSSRLSPLVGHQLF